MNRYWWYSIVWWCDKEIHYKDVKTITKIQSKKKESRGQRILYRKQNVQSTSSFVLSLNGFYRSHGCPFVILFLSGIHSQTPIQMYNRIEWIYIIVFLLAHRRHDYVSLNFLYSYCPVRCGMECAIANPFYFLNPYF